MQKLTHHLPTASRILLGGIFFVFGLNGFLNFIPMPPPEGTAATFLGGLAAAGYFFPFLKATEIAVGLLLLSGRFVPLALTVLAPITLNILAFHTFLAPGLGLPLAILALHLHLAWSYRTAYRGVLSPAAQPTRTEQRPFELARAA